mmetsp:Transcript_24054/g.58445  ORF Transcript_24054/g.58445 Transcript_24054/m.58445 type:complete len:146 (+) Transcript_24054:61-498(+)
MLALRRAVQPARVFGARAHCQVPCGIFDDSARVSALKEDAATIRKAMVQIEELQGQSTSLAFNQATRWVMTKEDHANSVMKTVSDYMLAQRVKPELFDDKNAYREALEVHHTVLTSAMKTKQTCDVAAVGALDAAIDQLAPMYTK